MKKFLWTQTNKDGGEKLNTFNFIEKACFILKRLFKIMNANVVKIPISAL